MESLTKHARLQNICRDLFKSDYDRGYEAGKDSVMPKKIELTKTCPTCFETYIGTHICLEKYKSNYDRGYDAGRKSARRELGYGGRSRFCFDGD